MWLINRSSPLDRLKKFLTLAGLVLLLAGCGSGNDEAHPQPELEGALGRADLQLDLPRVKFRDITAEAGITFRHVNGGFGKKLLPETMGSGVAFFDYDNDGRQDLLFINSCYWPGYEDKDKPRPTLALYRNRGGRAFEDVTRQVGLDLTLYGMGVTAGDIDNDGWVDLFVTAVGGNRLFHNVPGAMGGRKFVDITGRSPDLAPHGGWETAGDFLGRADLLDFPSSAAFFDYDNDGLLDLFVCNYLTWSPRYDLSQGFTLAGHGPAYGPPRAFKGAHCQLFKNRGGLEFVDVSVRAGIPVTGERGERVGKALGVSACDADTDGWQDVFVANDTERYFFPC